MAEIQKAVKKHNLTITNREKLNATGILSVDFFSDELITAQTDLGQLNIKGAGLHIDSLNSETGDLFVTGRTVAVSYSEIQSPASMFRRIFK